MKNLAKKLFKNTPYIKRLNKTITSLQSENVDLKNKNEVIENELKKYKTWVEPGHFYSPYADLKKIKEKEGKIFNISKKMIPGINLNESGQLEMLDNLSRYYSDIDFPEEKSDGHRYFYNNASYLYGDAIFLNMMIRYIEPKKNYRDWFWMLFVCDLGYQ